MRRTHAPVMDLVEPALSHGPLTARRLWPISRARVSIAYYAFQVFCTANKRSLTLVTTRVHIYSSDSSSPEDIPPKSVASGPAVQSDTSNFSLRIVATGSGYPEYGTCRVKKLLTSSIDLVSSLCQVSHKLCFGANLGVPP